jgi:cellulose synthase/poly-beta-1,6-N-acetylglucosamine synthase-like glycosyltransferase
MDQAPAADVSITIASNNDDKTIVLPTPPHDADKMLYLTSNRWLLFGCGVFSFLSLSTGLWLFVRANPAFYWFGACVGFFTIYLVISYIGVCALGSDFDYDEHVSIVTKNFDFKPTVDIFLPCCGESIEILENTWTYVKQLDYPHFKVHVLDDGAKDEVKAMAEKFGFNYVRRPNRPELRKAGNLRYAFSITDSEFFVIFDADFCPRTDFLKDVLPYFKHDPKIAIVQTPQFFKVKKEQTWVEQGAGIVQELFYRLVQVNRNKFGASICVGTCGTYRRSSLVPFGGTAAIGYSEDVHTGFSVLKTGWKVTYIPIVSSMGVCPDSLPAFFIQQYRWAMGSTTLFLNPEFWKSDLTVMQKVCYLTGMLYYSATALQIFTNPLPAILLVWIKPNGVFWYNTAFTIPSIVFSGVVMRLWCKQYYSVYATKVKIVQFYAHLYAIKDKLRNSMLEWVPSGGGNTTTSRFLSAQILCGIWTFLTCALTLAGASWRISQGYEYWHFIPTMVISVVNAYLTLDFVFCKT